jgi:tRNA1(Val) A37 N6-methylase TrmN6
VSAITEDAFLNGKVKAQQPRAGFRAGMDTIMLSASIPAKKGDHVLELGAGVGIASLSLATRVPGCEVTGIEIEAEMLKLANENARLNHLEKRVHFVEADIFRLPAAARKEFDHVFCNPPFHEAAARPALERMRQRALQDRGQLADWIAAGFKRVASKGTFTAIIRADRLSTVMGALPSTGVNVFPLWPKPVEPAKRVIVQVTKGSQAQSVILPGLVLHDDDGKNTPEAEAILRGERALSINTVS